MMIYTQCDTKHLYKVLIVLYKVGRASTFFEWDYCRALFADLELICCMQTQ